MAIRKSSNSGIPFGESSGRPSNANPGQPYFNATQRRLELYTANGWQNIVSETPAVTGINGNYLESNTTSNITIVGTSFAEGCTAQAVGTNGVIVDANSTTINSAIEIVANFSGLVPENEPYDVRVTNLSNLYGQLNNILYVNESPVWQTSAGSLGNFVEQVSISLSATATDTDSTISYALASGSTLPSGITLNSSTGLISGTLPDISANTTYTFTVNASDGLNSVVPRTFSILSKAFFSSEYLVVAGGGGGGGRHAGAGGAGGMLSGSLILSQNVAYAITVGNGGLGSTNNAGDTINFNGENSIFSSVTSTGGGRGGSNSVTVGSGGSGGGGNGNTPAAPGSGISGQGNSGGTGGGSYAGAGGGGAGSAGNNNNGGTGGAGGNGLANSITGASIVYAGGGGGGGWSGNPFGAGGTGGGGAGSGTNGTDNNGTVGVKARNGTDGLGGGGGGGGVEPGFGGGNGGSGVVIIAYPDTFPAITTISNTLTYNQPTRAGYRVYRFTGGTGTITI